MPTLLYIHGFLSSSQSSKSRYCEQWLKAYYSDWSFVCPDLSAYPSIAYQQLSETFLAIEGPVYIIGSSLGGFWASYFVEKYKVKAVLVNPAVMPGLRFQTFVGVELKNYHNQETYQLSQKDIDDLLSFEIKAIHNKTCYWLMVQTGDETLDYRRAVEHYKGCKQLVEADGNHSFAGFEKWLPEIMAFFQSE